MWYIYKTITIYNVNLKDKTSWSPALPLVLWSWSPHWLHSGTCSPMQLMSSLSYIILHYLTLVHVLLYSWCHHYLTYILLRIITSVIIISIILITITLADIFLLSCQKHYPNDHDYFILTAFNLENILLHTVELCLLIKCHIMSSDQIKKSSSD